MKAMKVMKKKAAMKAMKAAPKVMKKKAAMNAMKAMKAMKDIQAMKVMTGRIGAVRWRRASSEGREALLCKLHRSMLLRHSCRYSRPKEVHTFSSELYIIHGIIS